MFRLTWNASVSEIDSEVNNGRGPVDFKASQGRKDKILVEFKLASNTQLKRNLQNQVEVYKKANQTSQAIKVILYFSDEQLEKVTRILRELDLKEGNDLYLIDARPDKPSASKA